MKPIPLDFQVLATEDTSDLDALLLDDQGRHKVVPASTYAGIPRDKLRLWCHQHAIYGLPTPELIDMIRAIINGRSAIEIGSGAGCLGRTLGIPLTDNLCQTWPDVAAYYTITGQPVIRYPQDVEPLNAQDAIRKYRPKVVVASWVTQITDGTRPGSMYGVDEDALLAEVETYIVFGSIKNHGHKGICRIPHRVIQEPWMWSRAQDTALFVWGG